MKVAVTGASGLIGSALVPHLRSVGHDVVRLVRRAPSGGDEIRWDPKTGYVDLDALAGVEGVIHLAGAGVGDHRWSDAYKREILDSRVEGTRTIATAVAQLDPRPRVLVSASAIGFYGDTGDRMVDEGASAGQGFLADVTQAWEAASAPAAEAGIRVVHPRTGLVVSGKGGAWGRMFPLFRFGLGGKLGPGSQYWSWISMRDEVCALQFLLEQDHLSGPVNLTGPTPVTNAEITSVMGKVMGRPTILPAPAFALKAVLGEFSTEVLGSSRVVPTTLMEAQFVFQDPTIESAIRTALAEGQHG
jgi:uncharacterized protein (TIGR01777 family)